MCVCVNLSSLTLTRLVSFSYPAIMCFIVVTEVSEWFNNLIRVCDSWVTVVDSLTVRLFFLTTFCMTAAHVLLLLLAD